MKKTLLLLTLVTLTITQQTQMYLPKQLNFLPVNDLYMSNVARSGKTDFWKVDDNYWTTITASYPVRPNSITKISFKIISGQLFLIGCGKAQFTDTLSNQHVGQFPNSVGYYTGNGKKYKNNDGIDYSYGAIAGDTITMTIDLRPFENTVSFAKNGLPMGIAFSGIDVWGDVYIMFSLGYGYVGQRIQIGSYEVQE